MKKKELKQSLVEQEKSMEKSVKQEKSMEKKTTMRRLVRQDNVGKRKIDGWKEVEKNKQEKKFPEMIAMEKEI